ncbi:MAG TPA: HAD-IC family P-type ATPase [Gemmatimonadaceae bacterium]
MTEAPAIWPTPPHARSADDVLRRLASGRSGLTDAEARERLRRVGPNALRAPKPASVWSILVDQFRGVVVWLLLAAVAVSLAIGDLLEAGAIGAVLVINTLIGFVTALRARRAMEALSRLDTPRAVVVRDGRAREIDARELVPGDVIQVDPGQSVPADARLLEAAELRVNEAPLTGESSAVGKRVAAVPEDTPLPARSDMLFKGTMVVAGTARALVVETGMSTELGRIGGLVAGIREEPTPLERRLDALGRALVWAALAVGAIVAALGALRHLPLGRMVEIGLALAIAAVPEGLPAVATIALAVGVRRMARRRALVRRLPSVETLGSVTVICTDKTGTLTAGEMTVTVLALDERTIAVTGVGYAPEGTFVEDGRTLSPAADPPLREALRIGMMTGRADVERRDGGWEVRGDPTDAALLVAARKAGLSPERALEGEPLVGEVPFSSERMLSAAFHESAGDGLVAFVKGAPHRVLDLCDQVLGARGPEPLDDAGRERALERNRALAASGLRVLALARGRVPRADERALHALTFVGFAGMIDPAAPGVKDTIRVLRHAGIRTVMITGDQQLTARAIARDLGMLGPDDEVLDGRTLAHLSDAELGARVGHVGAFSRVSPEDKLRLVAAHQRRGEIVAMLGDGVNDAAALKKADVGVAMGIRGTDMAKEAAAVVLQDDRFRTIGAAVEEGRAIFDNIRKFAFYLFSCNLAEVLVLLVAGVSGLPLPLLPMQILWLNLVTDTFPALALAIEPAERDVMARPPRDPREALLSARFFRETALYAALITAVTLVAFGIGLQGAGPLAHRAQTLSFMTLALAQAFHLGNARSRASVLAPRRALANPWAVGAVALVVLLQLLAVYVPSLARVLHTQPLGRGDWLIVACLALIPALVGQVAKLVSSARPRADAASRRARA